MPRLYKRGRVWYSDLRISGRRVRQPLASDRVVAEERLADLIKDREAARHGHPRRDLTWAAYKKKYLEWAEGTKAPATLERDRAAVAALEKLQMPRLLSDVTPELLDRWKAARKVAGKGNATINRDLRAVKAMMRKAWEWHYVREWRGALVKKLPESPGRLLFYTPEDLGRLLRVCRTRFSGFYDWTTIALLGARAGLRRAEIYWLAWADVDMARGILTVAPKEGWRPKTGEVRHVPIPADLKKHLAAIKRSGPWVIGERPSLAVMSAFFQKISRKAKLRGNLHTLRHTYASHLVQAGVDLFTVSRLLGHSDVNMTKVYAHLAPQHLAAAVARLPRLPL